MGDLERFLANVDQQPDGCWLWKAGRTGTGYGAFYLRPRRQVRTHRYAYETFVGPIPEGLDLDHLCRVRHCCNPEHLEPVTRRENLIRGETLIARQVRVVECPNGHPYTPENTMRYQGTSRKCRTCHNERRRKGRARV